MLRLSRSVVALVLAAVVMASCSHATKGSASNVALDAKWAAIAVDLAAVKASVSPQSGSCATTTTAEVVCGPFRLGSNTPVQYAAFSAAPGAKPKLVDSTAAFELSHKLPATVDGTPSGVVIPKLPSSTGVAVVIDQAVFERQGREQLVTLVAAQNAANEQPLTFGGPVHSDEQFTVDSATPTSCWVGPSQTFCGPILSDRRPGPFYMSVGDFDVSSDVEKTAPKVVWPGKLRSFGDLYVLTQIGLGVLPDSTGRLPAPMS